MQPIQYPPLHLPHEYTLHNNVFYGGGSEPVYHGQYQVPHYHGPALNQQLGYHVVRGQITQNIHEYTLKLLDHAANIALSVKNPQVTQAASSPTYTHKKANHHNTSIGNTYNIDLSHKEYNVLSTKQTVVVNNNGGHGGKKEENNDTAVRVIGAIIGICALLGGAFLLAKSQSKNENLEKEIKQFEKLVNKWDYHRQAYAYSPDYEKRVNRIIREAAGIMERNQSHLLDTIYNVALPILVTGALLLVGAVVGGTVGLGMMAVGGLGLVGAGVYAFYKSVKNSYSNVDPDAADKILKNIALVQQNTLYVQTVHTFQIPMQYAPSAPPAYF